jgi:predicted HicB family RNase H-like nuclease
MKKSNAADKYTYRVIWSEEDREYAGLCTELPSLSWLAASQAEALRGIVEAAREVVEDMAKKREPIPEPIAARTYSGTFKVRIPPQVHRKLAMEAAEEHVSLNRLVSAKLAHG